MDQINLTSNIHRALLKEFQDSFCDKPTKTTKFVKHYIPTGDHTPVHSAPHRASLSESQTISDLIDDMLSQGIVRESRSALSSPVVIVTPLEVVIFPYKVGE